MGQVCSQLENYYDEAAFLSLLLADLTDDAECETNAIIAEEQWKERIQELYLQMLSEPVDTLDADAVDYIRRVEIADGYPLEESVKLAINDLFVGLKADPAPIAASNWEAIQAGTALLMAGPRTLAGALVPLHAGMPTPTNVNFVSGDYNRVGGLTGKDNAILDYAFAPTGLPQNDVSLSAVCDPSSDSNWGKILGSVAQTGSRMFLFKASPGHELQATVNNGNTALHANIVSGFIFAQRLDGLSYTQGVEDQTEIRHTASLPPSSENFTALCDIYSGNLMYPYKAPVRWLQVGRAMDIYALKSRLATYMSTIASILA